MKSSAIFIIGGIIIVGAVTYGIYKNSQGKKEPKDFKTVEPIITQDESHTQATVEPELSQVKVENATSISKRHSEASHVICDSLQTIFNEKHEEADEEIDEALDQIDSRLDDLLK